MNKNQNTKQQNQGQRNRDGENQILQHVIIRDFRGDTLYEVAIILIRKVKCTEISDVLIKYHCNMFL